MVENSIIKLCLRHEHAVQADQAGLTPSDFPKELQPVYSVLANYHAANTEDLSVDDLANLFFASVQKDKEYYLTVFESLRTLEVGDYSTRQLIDGIVRNKKLKELSVTAYEAVEGKKEFEDVQKIWEGLSSLPSADVQEADEFMTDDIELIVEMAFSKPGLRWRLNTMNRMLGSLRHGDFGFVFARPETGKTTFLASEVSYMAQQVDRPIIWFANEEDGSKVVMRIYQATFGIDLATLNSDLPGWRQKFRELTKGNLKIVTDMQFMHRKRAEKLLEKYNPALTIFDQLSKMKGFDNDRYDLELGAATTWARELAKTYGPVIGTHQADGNGEGVARLNMGHVANAKTAMQADADWILGIGKVHGEQMQRIRYLHLCKNKLTGDSDTDPQMRHGFMETLIDPLIGRYEDMF